MNFTDIEADADVPALFEARKRFWLSQGYRGAGVYSQLAVDEHLPTELSEEDAATILRVRPETMKARRRQKKPPTYTRHLGGRGVTYSLATLCDMLGAGTVEAA